MSKTLKPGDEVEWQTSQGKTSGVVKKKLTSKRKIKSHVVAASKENPEYLVQSKNPARSPPTNLARFEENPEAVAAINVGGAFVPRSAGAPQSHRGHKGPSHI